MGQRVPTLALSSLNPPSSINLTQAHAAGAALSAAHGRITHIAVSPYTRCLQTAAGVLAGLGAAAGAGVVVEVDPALSEVAGPPFVRGAPWEAATGDDGAWLWAGGSPGEALTAAGLPPDTPVVGASSLWPPRSYPESLEAGHARYDGAIAAAASRAGHTGGGDGQTLLLITHGEAVRRAVTRLEPGAAVYEARHCGWVACAWRCGDDGDGDPGEWALLPGASAGVAWLDQCS